MNRGQEQWMALCVENVERKFPKPHRLGANSVGFLSTELLGNPSPAKTVTRRTGSLRARVQ